MPNINSQEISGNLIRISNSIGTYELTDIQCKAILDSMDGNIEETETSIGNEIKNTLELAEDVFVEINNEGLFLSLAIGD